MRDDYFTLEELSWVVRLHRESVRRMFSEYPDFPVNRVGNKYIIPKLQFFRWYSQHKNDEGLKHRLDEKRIENERTEYIMKKVRRRVI